MLYINPNEAAQEITVTLKDRWKDFATHPESYLLQLTNTNNAGVYYLIPIIVSDNSRYSLLRIGTNVLNAVGGSVLLTETGEYSYVIYGQSGTTNLNPVNAAIIGVYEIGTIFVNSTPIAEVVYSPTIPETIVNE